MSKFLVILIISLSISAVGQDYLTTDILSRVFQIKYNDKIATCFLIEYDSANYYITAKHLFGSLDNKSNINVEIRSDSIWKILVGEYLISGEDDDIAVINPKWNQFVNAIELGNSNTLLGDDGYFIGFPFGLYTEDKAKVNDGFPFPIVKKLVFSGVLYKGNTRVLLFDGNNNPGFSGAPILFKNRMKNSDKKYRAIGVVSAYINQDNELVTPIGKINYSENSGIIVGTCRSSISQIIEINK